jgi:hypothetical protein
MSAKTECNKNKLRVFTDFFFKPKTQIYTDLLSWAENAKNMRLGAIWFENAFSSFINYLSILACNVKNESAKIDNKMQTMDLTKNSNFFPVSSSSVFFVLVVLVQIAMY